MISNTESLEALTAGNKDDLRDLVLEHIRSCKLEGSTADEAGQVLGLVSNSVAPRFVELARAGRILRLIDGDGQPIRRKTRQGCSAAVWIAAEYARPIPGDTLFGELAPDRSYRE